MGDGWEVGADYWKARAERAEAEIEEYKKTVEAWEQGHVGQLCDEVERLEGECDEYSVKASRERALADELAERFRVVRQSNHRKSPTAVLRIADAALTKWEEARK